MLSSSRDWFIIKTVSWGQITYTVKSRAGARLCQQHVLVSGPPKSSKIEQQPLYIITLSYQHISVSSTSKNDRKLNIRPVYYSRLYGKVNLISARLSETITDSNHLTKRPFESAGMAFGIGLILSSSINEQLAHNMLSPMVYYILVHHNGPNGIINSFFNDRPPTQLDQEKVTYGFFIQFLLTFCSGRLGRMLPFRQYQGGEYQKRFRQSVSAQVVACLAVVTLIKDCQQNLEIP